MHATHESGRMWAGLMMAVMSVTAQGAAVKQQQELAPEAIRGRIQQYRTAQTTLTVAGADGKPLANAPVVVRQVRHRFLFGCNVFGYRSDREDETQQAYRQQFAELMNFATLPFYWGSYEQAEGRPAAERLKAMAQWCAENGIQTKGHPLCWQQVFPRWLMERPLEEVHKQQLQRTSREIRSFAGLVDTWDAVNEAVVMPTFKGEQTRLPELAQKIGTVELIKQVFAAARAANPKVSLILNDYDTSAEYEKLIEECLKAGVKIDAIGIQSHMHNKYRGAEWTWETTQRFSRFGRPVHFTETTIISGDRGRKIDWTGPAAKDWVSTPEGEAQQACEVVEFYTVLFSHPAVQAITWWDFEDGAWLGAPAGLVRKDMSAKPAYEALKKLIKGEWWTGEVKKTTDATGQVTFRGFLGDYAVEGAGGKGTFAIEKAGTAAVRVEVK